MKRIIVHLFQIIILYILGSGYSNPSHLPIKENNLERIKSEKCELEWFSGSWTALGTGLNSTALSVAVDNNDHVYAGGFFTSKIRKWDGTSWTVPGFTGLNGDCQVIKVDKTNNLIYAGGNFTSASGTPASRIARWNGTNWSALGSGSILIVMLLP